MFAVHSLADCQQRLLQTGPTLWAIVELTHSHTHTQTHIGKLQEIQILKQIVFDAPVPQCSRCHFEPAAQQEVAPWLERLLANPPPASLLPLFLLFRAVQLFACGRVGDYSDNSILNRRKTFGPNCPLSVLDLVINSLPEKFSLNKKELSKSENERRERELYVNVDFLQCNFDRLQRCLLNLLLHFW